MTNLTTIYHISYTIYLSLPLTAYLYPIPYIPIDYISDNELEEELHLPRDLRGLGAAEKRELLAFMRGHSEMEYENELLRRTDELRKFRDLDELTKLRGKGAAASAEKRPKDSGRAKAKAKKAPAGAGAKGTGAKRKATRIESEEESEFEEEEEEGGSEEEEGEEDEDWFDNEEVEKAMAMAPGGGQAERAKGAKTLGRRSRAPPEDDEEAGTGAGGRGRAGKKSKNRMDEHSDSDASSAYGDAEDSGYGLPVSARKRRREGDRDRDGSPGARPRKLVAEKPPSPEAALADVLRIQLRRAFISTMISEPYFEDVMVDSFVRMYSHADPATNEGVYKMGRILELKPYARGEYLLDGKQCNRVLAMDDGSGRLGKYPNVKFSLFSNSRITEQEFNTYRSHCLDSKGAVAMPSVADVDEVRDKNVSSSQRTLREKDVLRAVRGSAGGDGGCC
jgi:hypothetical protein